MGNYNNVLIKLLWIINNKFENIKNISDINTVPEIKLPKPHLQIKSTIINTTNVTNNNITITDVTKCILWILNITLIISHLILGWISESILNSTILSLWIINS